MRPYYARGGVTLYNGDALSIIPQLSPATVDMLLTDSPYSSGGQFRSDRVQDTRTKYANSDSKAGRAQRPFSGDNRDQRSFALWASLWIGATLPILKVGAIAALFTDWRQLPTVTDILQTGGYVWRGIVPWHKPASRPMLGRYTNACEFVVWGTNGPRAVAGLTYPGLYSISPPRAQTRLHLTQKPTKLIVDLLAIVPVGGLVLDCFAGSGTTLEAAKLTGRRAIGIEIDEAFCEVIATRLEGVKRAAA